MANNRTTRMRATKTNQSETARRQMADGRPQLSAFISRQRICFFFLKKKYIFSKKVKSAFGSISDDERNSVEKMR